jgi:phospholipase/carboxylesterase
VCNVPCEPAFTGTPAYRGTTLPKITNGRSLRPLAGGDPKQIVLLLHGYGSNGDDLIALAGQWQHLFPDTLFLAPNAPQRCGMGAGYQWWALDSFSPAAMAAGAAAAAPAVDAFIDRKLDQYGLTESNLALVGFSQGTMMALHVGLRRPRPPAGILGYSGALTGIDALAGELKSKPPVLLIHGSADQVVPPAALHIAERTLTQLGIEVGTHLSQGLGHSVDAEGLRRGAAFLGQVLIGSS